MRHIVRLALLALAFVAARQLLEWQAELAAAKEDLASQREDIEVAETEVERAERQLDASEARLDALAARLRTLEQGGPGGVSRSHYAEYQALVAEHNQAVAEHNEQLASQRALRDDYSARVRRHNGRVDEANVVAGEGPLCTMLPASLRPARCGGGD